MILLAVCTHVLEHPFCNIDVFFSVSLIIVWYSDVKVLKFYVNSDLYYTELCN